jgi:WD40 repeat protein
VLNDIIKYVSQANHFKTVCKWFGCFYMKKSLFLFFALLFAGFSSSQAELADTIWTHPIAGEVKNVKFSFDGKYIYAGNNSQITKIDAVTNQEVYKILIPTTLTGMDLSQDGKIIAVACDTTLEVFDTETGEKLHTLFYPLNTGANRYRITQEIKSVSISYDNTFIGVVFNGGAMDNKAQSTIAIWELQTGKLVLNSIERNLYYQYFAFSPTENKYAVGFANPNQNKKVPIEIYEVGTWKLLKQFEGHTEILNGLKFSKDGNYLSSWSNSEPSEKFKIWDMNTLAIKPNTYAKYSIANIWDICFLNDSALIASAGAVINLDKQTKSTIDDINVGSSLLDVPRINTQNLLIAGNYGGMTLYKLDKTLDVKLINSTPIILYPNPVNKELTVSLPETNNVLVNYRIMNNIGQEILHSSSIMQNNTLKINVSSLPIGSYILNLNLNNTQHSIKFVKE